MPLRNGKVGVLVIYRAQTEWNRAMIASLSFDGRGVFYLEKDGGSFAGLRLLPQPYKKGGMYGVEANERGYRCHI